MKKKVNIVIKLILLVSICGNVFLFWNNQFLKEKSEVVSPLKKEVMFAAVELRGGEKPIFRKWEVKKDAALELQEGGQLVFGEWEITEYLGGGMYDYSIACGEARILKDDDMLKEMVSIYPDHVIVDGVISYVDIFVLYAMVPRKWIYEFIFPLSLGNGYEELEKVKQDFYLRGNLMYDYQLVENSTWLLKDAFIILDQNTIITVGRFGFFKYERIKEEQKEEN